MAKTQAELGEIEAIWEALCHELNETDPERLHELWVEDKLAELREKFHRFTLEPGREDSQTGVRKHKIFCDCGERIEPTQSIFLEGGGDSDTAIFCDECFDARNRERVEIQRGTGLDWC